MPNSEIRDYIKLGVDLVNRHVDLNHAFADWPKERKVILRVCEPNPEVAAYISDWLALYVRDELKDGAVTESTFSMFLDTSAERYQIALTHGIVPDATADIFMAESEFWDIAARTDSIYTAYITHKQMEIRSSGGYDLRDLAHMDKLLELLHSTLQAHGVNLASLVRA